MVKFRFRQIIQFLTVSLDNLVEFQDIPYEVFMRLRRTSHYVKIFPGCDSFVIVFIVKGKAV